MCSTRPIRGAAEDEIFTSATICDTFATFCDTSPAQNAAHAAERYDPVSRRQVTVLQHGMSMDAWPNFRTHSECGDWSPLLDCRTRGIPKSKSGENLPHSEIQNR